MAVNEVVIPATILYLKGHLAKRALTLRVFVNWCIFSIKVKCF
jgi:hypothetical protein